MEPPERTPESLYEELVFRPIFEAYSHKLDEAELTASQRAEVYQRALLRGYERQIQNAALFNLIGDESYTLDEITLEDVKTTPEYKEAAEKKIREVAARKSEVYYTRSIINVEIGEVRGKD